MTCRLVMTKKDPRRTDFVLVGDRSSVISHPGLKSSDGGPTAQSAPVYTSTTMQYARPRNGARATTTVTRTAPTGDCLQVGVIEWPVDRHHRAHLVVGTRNVLMAKSGIFTSPEQFTAADGDVYEWQIRDAQPQLVSLRTHRASTSYVATFVQSESGFWPRRKRTSSLFIPPEGFQIIDDIVVTFIYFESIWRDKEGAKARISISGPIV